MAFHKIRQYNELPVSRQKLIRRRARTAGESTTVDPDHHGKIARGRIGGAPDVQVQAILGRPLGRKRGGRCRSRSRRSALSCRCRRTSARAPARRRPESSPLHTAWSEFRGLSHSRPPRRRLWWTPPQLTDRWRGKGNALEGDHAIDLDSLQPTAVNSHDCGRILWLALVGFLCAC